MEPIIAWAYAHPFLATVIVIAGLMAFRNIIAYIIGFSVVAVGLLATGVAALFGWVNVNINKKD